VEQVLRRVFGRYQKIILRREFGGGLSGGRVFEVRPIRTDGAPELPAVVKVAPISLIQQEWRAYGQHVQHRLPQISPVTGRPVLVQRAGLGGLRYAMRGEGAFEVISLRDYCRAVETTPSTLTTVIERLLRIMHSIWGFHHLHEGFRWSASYDQVLPANLLVQTTTVASPRLPRQITPANLPLASLQPGDVVRLAEFAVHKVHRDTETITLKAPPSSFDTPAAFVRCKTLMTAAIAALPANEIIAELVGEVLETRASRLQAEVWRAFGGQVDPAAPSVLIEGQISLPNPLIVLPTLLDQTRAVHIAAIHGDFNLENILIEPETGLISLIDFADAREDHVLHDFLRLETEVFTHLLPAILHRCNLPVAPTLADLLWRLHGTAFQPDSSKTTLPHPDLQMPWAILHAIRRTVRTYLADADDLGEYYHGLTLYLLGALKFKNLSDVPQQPLPKQIAFWGATLVHTLLTTARTKMDHPPPPLAPLLTRIASAVPVSVQPLAAEEATLTTLAEAERRLAALPLTTVATLGPLPAAARMPLRRNPHFIGRVATLQELAHALRGGPDQANASVCPVVITGLGGIGKTQLAGEFIYRYGRFFAGGVFWLSFADAGAVPAELAACGSTLALRPDFDELPLEEQVRLVMAAWQEPLPRLLIFDNCEDPELLARWRPGSGGCRVLATSRRAEWAGDVRTLPLDVLARDESIALLREHRPDADEPLLDAIAQEVGDLPLALHLAGSFLARYRLKVDADGYLGQLRAAAPLDHHSLQTGGLSPTGHVQNVSRTIALSYQRLDRADPTDALALTVLAYAACLTPGESIPYPLLRLTLNLEGTDLAYSARRPEFAVARLAELGLLRSTSSDAFQLHRLVVAFVQQVMAAEMATARATVESVLCSEAERINEAGYPAALLAWQTHLRTVVNAALERQDERAARLCHALGGHLRQIGDLVGAQFYLEQTVAIRRHNFGKEHEATARSLTDLAEIFEAQDKRDAARACLEQALAVQEKLPDHPDKATTLSHLGYHLHNRGYLEAARPYHERALAMRRNVLGGEHPLVAITLCHLAYIEFRQSNPVASRTYLEQALAIQQRALGPEHPETARTYQNLGELLMVEQRDLAEAQQIFEQALVIQQKVLPKEHPENARVLNNLGEVMYFQGKLAEAQAYFEAALAIRQRVLGQDHTDTALTFYDLGRVLQSLGNAVGAQALYTRALKIFSARVQAGHYLISMTQASLQSLDTE
jgi:tetratricopeptide (TPR) repeat protein